MPTMSTQHRVFLKVLQIKGRALLACTERILIAAEGSSKSLDLETMCRWLGVERSELTAILKSDRPVEVRLLEKTCRNILSTATKIFYTAGDSINVRKAFYKLNIGMLEAIRSISAWSRTNTGKSSEIDESLASFLEATKTYMDFLNEVRLANAFTRFLCTYAMPLASSE